MIRKPNLWKALTAAITLVATVFNAGLSKALTHQTQALPEQTIEERVARIRENSRSREEKITITPDITSPKPKTLVAQDNNPTPSPSRWRDWDDWANWSDWANTVPSEPTQTIQSR